MPSPAAPAARLGLTCASNDNLSGPSAETGAPVVPLPLSARGSGGREVRIDYVAEGVVTIRTARRRRH